MILNSPIHPWISTKTLQYTMAPETRSTKNQVKEVLMDEEVMATIKRTICQALDSKFQDLIERLDKQDGAILDLHNKVENMKSDLKHVQKQQATCEERNVKIDHQLNAQEQYSRRNCVRLFGVPEQERENTDELVCNIASKHMGVSLKPEHIDRSHRVRRRVEPAEGSGRKPRAIIIKLTSYRHRQLLLQNKRKLKESKTGYNIFEDLTAANRSLLWEAQKASRNPESKVESAWTIDGRIVVAIKAANNKTVKKLIHCRKDLDGI